jgi:hypothetical protein
MSMNLLCTRYFCVCQWVLHFDDRRSLSCGHYRSLPLLPLYWGVIRPGNHSLTGPFLHTHTHTHIHSLMCTVRRDVWRPPAELLLGLASTVNFDIGSHGTHDPWWLWVPSELLRLGANSVWRHVDWLNAAADPRHHNHSWFRVPRDLWPYFSIWQLW